MLWSFPGKHSNSSYQSACVLERFEPDFCARACMRVIRLILFKNMIYYYKMKPIIKVAGLKEFPCKYLNTVTGHKI